MTDAAADLPPETAPRQAPMTLWRFVRTLICEMQGLFGPPEQIAQSSYVTRAAYKLMSQWIGAAEAFIRRLLHIEAVAILSAGALPSPKPCARQNPRAKRLITFDPDQPEQWRVSFRCTMERRRLAGMHARQPAKAPAAYKATVHDAWPLALRCEALLRVFNDPIPYARRFARRLAARPALTLRMVSPILIRTVGGDDMWTQANALCAAAPAAVAAPDSS